MWSWLLYTFKPAWPRPCSAIPRSPQEGFGWWLLPLTPACKADCSRNGPGRQPLLCVVQMESPEMPLTDGATFPAALTSVFTFLNKTLNLLYCFLRGRKKQLWLLHTYFKRWSLPFTQTRGFLTHAATSISPRPTHVLGQQRRKKPVFALARFTPPLAVVLFCCSEKGTLLSFHTAQPPVGKKPH